MWFANGKTLDNLFAIRPSDTQSPEGIHRQLYEEDPEAVRADLERMVADVEAGPLPSYNSGGYGQAVLQAPYRDEGRALAMYYGRMTGHGHNDRLNYILVARNVVMTPDMGYPLFCNSTWRPRFAWDSHIISHNTCMVNDTNPDTPTFSGKTRLFAEAGPARHRGGWRPDLHRRVHLPPLHGDGGRGRGAFLRAGPLSGAVAAATIGSSRTGAARRPPWRASRSSLSPRALTPGRTLSSAPSMMAPRPRATGAAASPISSALRRAARGRLHRRLADHRAASHHARGLRRTCARITHARGRGRPRHRAPARPQGQPESLRYLLRTRFGEDLTTQFVTVLEPYGAQPFIAGVRLLESVADAETFAAAVEVMLADGRRDVLLVREEPGELSAGGSSLSGRLGFARFEGDAVVTRALIAGERLEAGGAALTLPTAALTGTLVSFDDRDPADVRLRLDGPELTEDVVGRYIIFANTERSDASYRIERVVDAHTVSIGDCSLIERLADRGTTLGAWSATSRPAMPGRRRRT